MRALGYPSSWPTTCFLTGGCRRPVYAHTNGYGDFVLFDSLDYPWQIHPCYEERFLGTLRGTRSTPYPGQVQRSWERVRSVSANAVHRKRHSIVGTVTNVEPNFVGSAAEFQRLASWDRQQVQKSIGSRRSLMTIVTGDAEELTVFFDRNSQKIKFRDIVACTVKSVSLFGEGIFIANNIRIFKEDDGDK